MKTDKYNNMISVFQCDFSLARENNKHKLSDLQREIDRKEKFIMQDIDLLEELEYRLRSGKAEIHIIGE